MYSVQTISRDQVRLILSRQEGHFVDFKSKKILPSALTKYISGFANADGGEIYLGIEEVGDQFVWDGGDTVEYYNAHIQTIESLHPLSSYLEYDFLNSNDYAGVVLKVSIGKTRTIIRSSDGKMYIRRSAQCLPVTDAESIRRLEYAKGIASFENEAVNCEISEIANSNVIIRFVLDVVPTQEPEVFLRKMHQISGDRPIVSGVLLFSDEPQAVLPKRCGIKVYRYASSEDHGSREAMVEDPSTIDGCLYDQIVAAVAEVKRLLAGGAVLADGELKNVDYPDETLHEIITNAVLHRDYSMQDDIHIRIFDNRIEVESPGRLPGHIRPENILHERLSRNGHITRLINKFPDPPNKDIGEGLNTAFAAMHKMNLKEPMIVEREHSVLVVIRHEPLSSPEQLVMAYLGDHLEINNTKGREVCHIGSENKMKRIFEKLMAQGVIERIPERRGKATAYRKVGG